MQEMKEHWVTDLKEVKKDTAQTMGRAFDPLPSKDRKKTYIPINDQDN